MTFGETSSDDSLSDSTTESSAFVLPSTTPQALSQAINSKARIICAPAPCEGPLLPPGMQGAQITLRLSSSFVFSEPLAPAIAQGFGQRFKLTNRTVDNLSIALSEALSNGLIHGNLEVQLGEDHLDPKIWDLTNERAKDPHYSERLIWVSASLKDDGLCVQLRNEGPGFQGIPSNTNHDAHRGISLMQAATHNMTYSDGMRCLTMTFGL